VDLANFSNQAIDFTLTLEVAADFADQIEVRSQRQQHGEMERRWHDVEEEIWELVFDYRAKHRYDRQGNTGEAQLHRRLAIRIQHADKVLCT
jgi:hypothetical protein